MRAARRPAAVLCDLDGTLIDSTAAMVHALRVGCGAVGMELASDGDLAWCVGPRIEDSLRTLVGADRMIEARTAFRAEYRRSAPTLTRAMAGVGQALGAIAAAGIRLGVATYKPEPLATMILEATGLSASFEVIQGRRLDVEDERPKAAILNDALVVLGTGASESLYVGDRDEDAIAAVAVGTPFLRYGDVDWPAIAEIVLGDGAY